MYEKIFLIIIMIIFICALVILNINFFCMQNNVIIDIRLLWIIDILIIIIMILIIYICMYVIIFIICINNIKYWFLVYV